jgi:hypothetical protein
MAGIVTQHGNLIAWDWGMLKVMIQPVMNRLEPGGLAIFNNVMPDASILVSDAPISVLSSLPMHMATVAPQVLAEVPYNHWMAPVMRTIDEAPFATPLADFLAAQARGAAGNALPADEVTLSGAASRGVALPDGSIIAAGDVVRPPIVDVTPASAPVPAVAAARGSTTADAHVHPFPDAVPGRVAVSNDALPPHSAPAPPAATETRESRAVSKWGERLALVGSTIEVRWGTGWHAAEVVAEDGLGWGRLAEKKCYRSAACA